MSIVDERDNYDQEYKRQWNKPRNKIVNVEPKLVDIKPTNDTSNTTKIQPRHGGFTGQKIGKFWIRTLGEKNRKPSTLNQEGLNREDKDILAGMFGSKGDGVRKVASRDYIYDTNAGWTTG